MSPWRGNRPYREVLGCPRDVRIPRRILNLGREHICDMIGHLEIGRSLCWPGAVASLAGVPILTLPPRGPQWESPSDLCTLGADGI